MDIREAPAWVWSLVLLVIFGAVGALVLSEFKGTLTAGSTAESIVDNGTLGLANAMKQLPTVGIIVGVMLIIGAVVGIAMYFGRKQGYV